MERDDFKRSWYRWKDNTVIYFAETEWKFVDSFQLAYDWS
jgi:hypothetical protein